MALVFRRDRMSVPPGHCLALRSVMTSLPTPRDRGAPSALVNATRSNRLADAPRTGRP